MVELKKPNELCTRWWLLNEEHWFLVEGHRARLHRRHGLYFPDHVATQDELAVTACLTDVREAHACGVLAGLFLGYFDGRPAISNYKSDRVLIRVACNNLLHEIVVEGPGSSLFFLVRRLERLDPILVLK